MFTFPHTIPGMLLPTDLQVGPSILIAATIFVLLVAGFYYLIEIPRQRRIKQQWLRSNSDALRSHFIVQYCLNRWKEESGYCSKCGCRDLVLWDHCEDLLVIRCMGCRINYTLTENSGPMIARILQNISAEYVVLSGLKEYRNDLLGLHLKRSCGPCSTFVENKLTGYRAA